MEVRRHAKESVANKIKMTRPLIRLAHRSWVSMPRA
jgi:hypothetical protein